MHETRWNVMTMAKKKNDTVGATLGDSTPHQANAVLLDNGVSLFDFVKVGDSNVLCQVSHIKIQSDLEIDDAKDIARGKKKVPMYDVVAKLDVLIRRSHPIMPGSLIKLATIDEIQEFLLKNHDVKNHIWLGKLLRRQDVGIYLGGHFLDNHLAILGMIGMGKSTAGKTILSQTNWKEARAIVIDPHAEYHDGKVIDVDRNIDTDKVDLSKVLIRLRESIKDKQEKILDKVAKVVRHTMQKEDINTFRMACDEEFVHGGSTIKSALMDAIWTEAILNDIALEIENHDYSVPLIINLKGLNKVRGQAVVKHVADLVLTKGKAGVGSYLFIDEAQTYVPQRGTPECKTAIIDLITEGRKFNCGVVLMSQRPARVDKDVLSQCNSKIILKLTNENDIKQVRASTEFSTRQMFDEVQRLRRGEALLVSAVIERPVFIKVDKFEDKL